MVDFELPLDASLFGAAEIVPRCGFSTEVFDRCKATTRQALPSHGAQLVFGYVQPAAVLGRMAKLQPAHPGSRLLRCEGFVESAFGVRIEIVADE